MAQSKTEIQAVLEVAGARPRGRWGQNFMIDQNLVRVVAEAGELGAGDTVIEVGPGTGTLTEELLERAGKVAAVEIDGKLAAALRSRFGGREAFELIEGDVLRGKHELAEDVLKVIARPAVGCVKMVANLPYNIAAPVCIEMLRAGVELLAFTVQREVAQRLKAGAGSEDYGPLSVMAQLLSKVEVVRRLPPQAFWPAPNVESALVVMRRADRLGGRTEEFGEWLRRLFSSRRKTLANAIAQAGYRAEALATLGIDGRRRAEELTPEGLWGLFAAVNPSAGEVG